MNPEELREILYERKEMDAHQNRQLDEILWLIKGNVDKDIQGVMPRIQALHDLQVETEEKLNVIIAWKAKIDLATSVKTWKFIFKFLLGLGGVFLIIKHGWKYAFDLLRDLLL